AGADDPVVRPHRNAAPLPLLEHVGNGLHDQRADLGQHVAAPVAELLDSPIDELRGRILFRTALRHRGNWRRPTGVPSGSLTLATSRPFATSVMSCSFSAPAAS